MTFNQLQKSTAKQMARARRLLVLETVQNMNARYARYVRRHNLTHSGGAYRLPAKSFRQWLENTTFEETYLRQGPGGHQMPVRQSWTRTLLEEKVPSVTVGVNQTIDWFLIDLGKELTKRLPGYKVTAVNAITSSFSNTESTSLRFMVLFTS